MICCLPPDLSPQHTHTHTHRAFISPFRLFTSLVFISDDCRSMHVSFLFIFLLFVAIETDPILRLCRPQWHSVTRLYDNYMSRNKHTHTCTRTHTHTHTHSLCCSVKLLFISHMQKACMTAASCHTHTHIFRPLFPLLSAFIHTHTHTHTHIHKYFQCCWCFMK